MIMLTLFDGVDFVNKATNLFGMLLENAVQSNSFHTKDELTQYLFEGSLLQLSKLGEHYFSIPSGQYLVYTTSQGSTMLVPVSQTANREEVYEDKGQFFEVSTTKLLNNWNLLGKPAPLLEDDESEIGDESNRIDLDSVDRDAIVQAMNDQNMSVTDLADKVGVNKSTISRYLRKPKQGIQGDPGGRTPSLATAGEISTALRAAPTTLFPDVFKQNKRKKKRQGNRGSGVTSVTKNIKGRKS